MADLYKDGTGSVRMISLGPLLGIEGDYHYSLVVFLPLGIDAKSLKLEWSFNDEDREARPSPPNELRLNKAYRFEIPIEKHPESYVVLYRLLLEGLPLSDAAGDSEWEFVVPGKDTVPKIGFASCNGSSKDLPSNVPDSEYVMWDELWQAHKRGVGLLVPLSPLVRRSDLRRSNLGSSSLLSRERATRLAVGQEVLAAQD